ncbi:MAG: hypothetical protein Q8L60_10715 [Gammaproteobacteria bacterium]|nr:hypothetical protein [Gammaproteobacteria bacterium]MDP2346820.1 hypothetical protein [Gammaproteobacteria bacterium]
MSGTHIPTTKPRFKSTTITAEVQRADRKPEKYVVYQFTGRTFTKEDKPGRPPSS